MRFKASDGSMHGSQMKAYQASQGPNNTARPATPDASTTETGPKDIVQDDQAMDLISQLKQMGYTADDVTKAFDADQSTGGQEATQAAPLQIPGA